MISGLTIEGNKNKSNIIYLEKYLTHTQISKVITILQNHLNRHPRADASQVNSVINVLNLFYQFQRLVNPKFAIILLARIAIIYGSNFIESYQRFTSLLFTISDDIGLDIYRSMDARTNKILQELNTLINNETSFIQAFSDLQEQIVPTVSQIEYSNYFNKNLIIKECLVPYYKILNSISPQTEVVTYTEIIAYVHTLNQLLEISKATSSSKPNQHYPKAEADHIPKQDYFFFISTQVIQLISILLNNSYLFSKSDQILSEIPYPIIPLSLLKSMPDYYNRLTNRTKIAEINACIKNGHALTRDEILEQFPEIIIGTFIKEISKVTSPGINYSEYCLSVVFNNHLIPTLFELATKGLIGDIDQKYINNLVSNFNSFLVFMQVKSNALCIDTERLETLNRQSNFNPLLLKSLNFCLNNSRK